MIILVLGDATNVRQRKRPKQFLLRWRLG